jgi:hypothetical protein
MNAIEYNTIRGQLRAAIRFHEQRATVLQARLLNLQEQFRSELEARFRAPLVQPLLLEDRKYV